MQQEKKISARTQELQRQIAVERANRVELAEIVARQQEQLADLANRETALANENWRNRLHDSQN